MIAATHLSDYEHKEGIVSPTLDIADARIAVVDPDTPPVILQDIAAHHPTLWSLVAAHPNTSPQVLAWLQRVGDESVLNALAARESAMPFDEFMEVTEPIESPPPQFTAPPPPFQGPPPQFMTPPTQAPPTTYSAPPVFTPPVQPRAPEQVPPDAAMPPVPPQPQFIPEQQPFVPAPQQFIPTPLQFIPAPQLPFALPSSEPPAELPKSFPPSQEMSDTGVIVPITMPSAPRAKRSTYQSVSRWYTTDQGDKRQTTSSRNRMIALVIALVVLIVAGSGWLVYHAVTSNQTPRTQDPSVSTDGTAAIRSNPHVSTPWVTDITDSSFNINVSVTNPSGMAYSVCINNAGKQLACWDNMTATYHKFTTPVDGDYFTYPVDPTVELNF